MIFILLTGLMVLFTIYAMIAYAWAERDWPWDPLKGFLVSLGLFIMCVMVFT